MLVNKDCLKKNASDRAVTWIGDVPLVGAINLVHCLKMHEAEMFKVTLKMVLKTRRII
jgi:hypothetical protein